MNEELMRQIAQEVYDKNLNKNQMSTLRVPNHVHNGVDSPSISQDSITPGTYSSVGISSITSETFTIETFPTVDTLTLHGIAYEYLNEVYSFTGSLSGGATSATLNSNWSNPTGSYYVVTFSNGNQRNVTFTNGSTSVSWSGGLSSSATSSFTISSPKKAHINGSASIGNVFVYGSTAGSVSLIPMTNGQYTNIAMSSSAIFIDTSDLTKTRVFASGTDISGQPSYLIYVEDSTGTIVAKMIILDWSETSITFQTTFATNWRAVFYLTMS